MRVGNCLHEEIPELNDYVAWIGKVLSTFSLHVCCMRSLAMFRSWNTEYRKRCRMRGVFLRSLSSILSPEERTNMMLSFKKIFKGKQLHWIANSLTCHIHDWSTTPKWFSSFIFNISGFLPPVEIPSPYSFMIPFFKNPVWEFSFGLVG